MADFWVTIDQARNAGGPSAPSASPEVLQKMLSKLPTEDVQEFAREFSRKLVELNQWDLWAAGYVINGGMSDDSFHYFRSWIIGKGRDCFEVAKMDPSGLLPFLDTAEVDNELLEYVANEELQSRGIDDDSSGDDGPSPDDEPSGEPFDEDDVEDRFPVLARFAAGLAQSPETKPPKGGFFQKIFDRFKP